MSGRNIKLSRFDYSAVLKSILNSTLSITFLEGIHSPLMKINLIIKTNTRSRRDNVYFNDVYAKLKMSKDSNIGIDIQRTLNVER